MKAACDKIKAGEKDAKLDCFAGQYNKYEGLTVNFDEAVHGAGGVIVGDDGKPNVATPEATKGLQTLVDWFKDGDIPKAAITWQEEEGRQAFQNGELIFHRNWGYVYNAGQQERRLVQDRRQVRRRAAAGHHRSGRLQPGRSQLRDRQERREQGHRAGLPEVHVLGRRSRRRNTLATSDARRLEALYTDPDVVKKFPFYADPAQVDRRAPSRGRRPWSTVMSRWPSRTPPTAPCRVRPHLMPLCRLCRRKLRDADQVSRCPPSSSRCGCPPCRELGASHRRR